MEKCLHLDKTRFSRVLSSLITDLNSTFRNLKSWIPYGVSKLKKLVNLDENSFMG